MKRFFLWRHFANYFPIRVHKTSELDPDRNYLFVNHPHGIFCCSTFALFSTDALDFQVRLAS